MERRKWMALLAPLVGCSGDGNEGDEGASGGEYVSADPASYDVTLSAAEELACPGDSEPTNIYATGEELVPVLTLQRVDEQTVLRFAPVETWTPDGLLDLGVENWPTEPISWVEPFDESGPEFRTYIRVYLACVDDTAPLGSFDLGVDFNIWLCDEDASEYEQYGICTTKIEPDEVLSVPVHVEVTE